MNILDEIVARRKEDIANYGFSLGFEVPEQRRRSVSPFLAQTGVILEVKRASPSKGNIAPSLDAFSTATSYAEAGCGAISVLTEQHWFKGNLSDLRAVCDAVDSYAEKTGRRVAVLRKDFLLCPEEIEVAYKCGADAVLLIARILDAESLLSMAKKCAELGITALIELRLEEDLQKFALVAKNVDSCFFVCGVNARDLQDFSIDLLTPAMMFKKIRAVAGDSVRVIFESGIRTPQAARFVGSMGFTGMLLGEAAARNPSTAENLVSSFLSGGKFSESDKNAAGWLNYAESIVKARDCKKNVPFVKICGLTNLADAKKAAELGADFLGFIFYEKSPRRASVDEVRKISAEVRRMKNPPKLVGVVVSVDSEEGKQALSLVESGVLDFIQLHGCAESFFAQKNSERLPHYAVVNVSAEEDLGKIDSLRLLGEPRILIDAKSGDLVGGTGVQVSELLVDKVSKKTKLWLAGGITPENIGAVVSRFHPELVDVASGVEARPGKKDFDKLEAFFKVLSGI